MLPSDTHRHIGTHQTARIFHSHLSTDFKLQAACCIKTAVPALGRGQVPAAGGPSTTRLSAATAMHTLPACDAAAAMPQGTTPHGGSLPGMTHSCLGFTQLAYVARARLPTWAHHGHPTSRIIGSLARPAPYPSHAYFPLCLTPTMGTALQSTTHIFRLNRRRFLGGMFLRLHTYIDHALDWYHCGLRHW